MRECDFSILITDASMMRHYFMYFFLNTSDGVADITTHNLLSAINFLTSREAGVILHSPISFTDLFLCIGDFKPIVIALRYEARPAFSLYRFILPISRSPTFDKLANIETPRQSVIEAALSSASYRYFSCISHNDRRIYADAISYRRLLTDRARHERHARRAYNTKNNLNDSRPLNENGAVRLRQAMNEELLSCLPSSKRDLII